MRLVLIVVSLIILSSKATSNNVLLSPILLPAEDVTSVEILDPPVNGKVLLRAKGVPGLQYWLSDGTTVGSTRIERIPTVPVSPFQPDSMLTLFDNRGYFRAHNQVWETDGTTRGTSLFLDTTPQWIAVSGDILYVMGQDPNRSGLSLFRSNGYIASNLAIKPKEWEGKFRSVHGFENENGDLVFTIDNELWVTDGTMEGTSMVNDLSRNTGGFVDSLSPFVESSIVLQYPVGNGLWAANGKGGPILVSADLDLEYVSPQLHGGFVLFQAFNNSANQNALHVFLTNATSEGTLQLDFEGARAPQFLTDSQHEGKALVLLNQVRPLEVWLVEGPTTTHIQNIPNGVLAFASTKLSRGIHLIGILRRDGNRELWMSDYTTQGTRPINTLPGKVESIHPFAESSILFTSEDKAGKQTLYAMVMTESSGVSSGHLWGIVIVACGLWIM